MMRLWYLVVARLRSLALRGRRQRELDEELRFHLEQQIAQNVARGMSPEGARNAAFAAFGGIEKTKDECRDAWGFAIVDHLRRDARHASRRLARDWRFTVPAVLVLALGIGANTAMFSIVNKALFRPLPILGDELLVNIYQNIGESSQPFFTSYPAYRDLTGYTNLFAGVAAFTMPMPTRYQVEGSVRPGIVEYATANYPTVQRLALPIGRWFTAEEDRPGAPAVAVVSHRTWAAELGSAPDVLGRQIRINGTAVTVIGVAPEGHTSSFHSAWVTDFWLPASSVATIGERPGLLEQRDTEIFVVRARLRDGVSLPRAQAAMTVLGDHLASEYPDEDRGRGISVLPSNEVLFHPQIDAIVGAGASFLMIVVGVLLAIACTNLATWLLVRGMARAKEVTVRLALGASRTQIVRHLLVESTLLAAAGGLVGCVLAAWGMRPVTLMDLPIDASGGLDYRVLGLTLALSLLTGVAFGLAPALHATRVDLTPTLRADGDGTLYRGARKFGLRNTIVVAQVVLSCLLLVVEGVHLRALAATQAVDLGFSLEGLAFVETDARFAGYPPDEELAVQEELLARVGAVPGVESAALAVGPPPAWHRSGELVIDGYEPAEGERMVFRWIWAGANYFDLLGIPALHGRTFTDLDRPETSQVAVISESMARRYFGTANPVGKRFRVLNGGSMDDPGWSEGEANGAELEVIGVVPDVLTDLTDEPGPLFYRSYRQGGVVPSTVLVRTPADPTTLLLPLRRTVHDLDDSLPVIAASTLTEHVDRSLRVRRELGRLLGATGLLGLGLASLGLFAVVSFAVSRRSREIGIRTTLGARRTRVIWVLSKSVASLLAIGITVGLGLSWAALYALKATVASLNRAEGVSLSTVSTADPVAFLLVVLVMAAVGLAATFFPAWRATRANPLVALRHL